MTNEQDFVIEHIRERLRRLASQQDMLTCEHMLEAADEIERLELLAVNRLIEIDRLLADRDAERKIYNDAIARHLAEIARLNAKIKVIEEAALAAYRYHMLGYKDAGEFNANVMLDHMNKLGEVL